MLRLVQNGWHLNEGSGVEGLLWGDSLKERRVWVIRFSKTLDPISSCDTAASAEQLFAARSATSPADSTGVELYQFSTLVPAVLKQADQHGCPTVLFLQILE